jgi:hypothetical protein
VATVFNIVVTVLCFFILIVLYNVFLVPHIPAEKAYIGLLFLFIIAVIIAFVVYQRALRIYRGGFPPK